MNLTIDLSTRTLLTTFDAVTSISVKRRDILPLFVRFVSRATSAKPILIPGIAPAKLRIALQCKRSGELGGDFSGAAVLDYPYATWTIPIAATAPYRVSPVFHSDPLTALFLVPEGSGVEYYGVELIGEISWWDVDYPDVPASSETFTVTVNNDVIR